MSRRDTIIIAVLVNAGLLAVLFMLAINTEEDKVSDSSLIAQASVEVPLPQQPAKPETTSPATQQSPEGDEVDNVLKEYAANPILLQSDIVEDTPGPVPVPEPEAPKAPEPATDTDVKAPEGKFVEVTVKRGDALSKIARANNTTVEAIKKANNLPNEKLNIGQVLKVPTSTPSAQVPAPKPKAAAEAKPVAQGDVEYYTIKNGDNPWKIAKQFHVRFDELLKLNNLDEEKARNLKPGDKLRVK